MVIWQRAGLEKARTVAISLATVQREMGFDRATASRGLVALERAGLVAVRRAAGRKPEVTLLDWPPRDRAASGPTTLGSLSPAAPSGLAGSV